MKAVHSAILACLACLALWSGPSLARPTASQFVARAEAELAAAEESDQRAQWVAQNFITTDTLWLAARSTERVVGLQMQLAREAQGYTEPVGDAATRRRLELIRQLVRSPAPVDPELSRQWADLQAGLVSRYNSFKVPRPSGVLGSYGEVRHAMEITEDASELLGLWNDWHGVGRDLQPDYAKFIALSNEGAKAVGFHDTGELWRSVYDMPPNEMAADVERLWAEVKPLYVALHCHARAQLSAHYGTAIQPETGAIRIELTRNPVGMYWIGTYDLLAKDLPAAGYDLDQVLQNRHLTGEEMTRYADRFWSSLGEPPMPATFWTRSLFEKPRDREVMCPGKAAILDAKDDVRIKACAKPNAIDFAMLHHEVGHVVYARAYQPQSFLFRNSANDAFHEAVADLGALSITPEYLAGVGLIDKSQVPGPEQDVGMLLRMALQRVSFMPFSLIVDKWRWQVFTGEIPPERYNSAWWDMVAQYQGLRPGQPRAEGAFDVAALPHITNNSSYIRYFYAYLLEFQLYKAACDRSGWQGPLHRCSLFGDTKAGAQLHALLASGASRPWADTLEAATGQRRVSAAGMLGYFQPLQGYLDRQNRHRKCGW